MMVQFPNLEKLRSEPKQLFGPLPAARARVKSEIEDPLDEMYGPIEKRSKFDESVEQQLESKLLMPHGSLYDPLDEPSPLGLRLKKSPSFLDMIQTRLYQENSVSTSATSSGLDFTKKKELKSTAISGGLDKMKASNFPAAVLRIGNWEYLSRYEGDLVAKCYYAKHKLVWEVLDGGLKNKIEIQWSDITALKATCPENEPATLDVVLARRPLFFRETNPQPRKHTLWQATSDFTGGQASIHRRHFLQCHQGLLNRHFDKLIQCDPRLKTLNQQSEIVLESSCFEPSCLDDQDDPKGLGFDNGKENDATTSAGFQDSNLSYAKSELRDKFDEMLDRSTMQMHYHDSESPSFIGVQAADEVVYHDNRKTSEPSMQYEEPNARKLRPSMSKDDLVSHLEQCISKQMASGNPLFSTGCLPDKENLEELAEHLLTDSQSSVFDEKSLLSKVNSFYGLLQRDSSFPNLHLGIGMNTADHMYSPDDDCDQLAEKGALDDAQPCGISRKESFGELLMNLPRIASFPQFLFCIDEDNDD